MSAPHASPVIETAASATPAPHPSAKPAANTDALRTALDRLTLLLNRPAGLTEPASLALLHVARCDVARALDQLPQPPSRGPLMDSLLSAAESLGAHLAGTLAQEESAAAFASASSGWVADLARLFAAPAWQAQGLRPLADLPAWLWPLQARHVFAAPAFLATTEHETQWATHVVAQLDPLVRMLEVNRGSSAVRTVAQLVSGLAESWPCFGPAELVRKRQQALGRLRTALAPRLAPFKAASTRPEPGRPLRVGLIRDELSAHPSEVFESARLASLLDPERVELLNHSSNELLNDLPTQVETLRTMQLDAVIFAGDLTRTDHPLATLALYRVAPRQFATALTPHTTGLPEMDVFLTDSTSVSAAYTERLAVLPSALAFDAPVEAEGDQSAISRADLGLPDGARLLVATAHPAYTTAAARSFWKQLLDQDPTARLILVPGNAGPALNLLLAETERQLGDRVILAGDAPLDPEALTTLLSVCDAYLSTSATADVATRDLAQRLGLDVPEAPARCDCLAFADALTAVLETACRSPDAPLVAPAAACDAASRHAQGKELLAAGRPGRAALYLLAAAESADAGPDTWHELALALHADGQKAEALQALEACVRLNPGQLEPWLLLADWARDFGHIELVQEIADVVRELAPEHPRTHELIAHVNDQKETLS